MTPAFTISPLNFPMAVSNSVLGITPASLLLSAFTITINRIVMLRWAFHFGRWEVSIAQPRLRGYDERGFSVPTSKANYFADRYRQGSIVDGLIGRGPEIDHGARRLR
jgi:hypothetical protein